jgi:hypothetical protein
MPPALAFLTRSLPTAGSGGRRSLAWACLALLHLAALVVLLWTEVGLVPRIAFVLTWGFLNFTLLVVLRRPMAAAALTDMPCISSVVSLVLKKDTVEALRKGDRGGRQKMQAPFPCTVLFEEGETPRVVKRRLTMAAKSQGRMIKYRTAKSGGEIYFKLLTPSEEAPTTPVRRRRKSREEATG